MGNPQLITHWLLSTYHPCVYLQRLSCFLLIVSNQNYHLVLLISFFEVKKLLQKNVGSHHLQGIPFFLNLNIFKAVASCPTIDEYIVIKAWSAVGYIWCLYGFFFLLKCVKIQRKHSNKSCCWSINWSKDRQLDLFIVWDFM